MIHFCHFLLIGVGVVVRQHWLPCHTLNYCGRQHCLPLRYSVHWGTILTVLLNNSDQTSLAPHQYMCRRRRGWLRSVMIVLLWAGWLCCISGGRLSPVAAQPYSAPPCYCYPDHANIVTWAMTKVPPTCPVFTRTRLSLVSAHHMLSLAWCGYCGVCDQCTVVSPMCVSHWLRAAHYTGVVTRITPGRPSLRTTPCQHSSSQANTDYSYIITDHDHCTISPVLHWPRACKHHCKDHTSPSLQTNAAMFYQPIPTLSPHAI